MIKMLMAFIVIFSLFFGGIIMFRQLTKKEQWNLIKTLGYATICALLTLLVIGLFVIIF